MSYREDVAEVKRLTKAIDRSEADVESWKWARAERLAEIVEAGHSRTEVGRDTGLGRDTVSRAVAIWLRWGATRGPARPTYREAYQQLTGDTREHSLATSRITTQAQAEDRVREIAKRFPDAVLDVAVEAAGQTRQKAPSNKAKVEQAFGPEEFNRLDDAIVNLLERLQDLAPNREDKEMAIELADKAEAVAQVLRAWARGESVGEEAAAWLEQQ